MKKKKVLPQAWLFDSSRFFRISQWVGASSTSMSTLDGHFIVLEQNEKLSMSKISHILHFQSLHQIKFDHIKIKPDGKNTIFLN